MKIDNIVIVGGGSSGWMTAAALIKQFGDLNITLVESPNIPTVGVGESTILSINDYMHLVGLYDKDDQWMKHCDANYKTSIKFSDFTNNPKETPEHFHYPFGNIADMNMQLNPNMFYEMQALFPDEVSLNDFALYFHNHLAYTKNNKMTFNENNSINGFIFKDHTAYQFDATMFGEYLKKTICLPLGINHIVDDVMDIQQNDDESINCVVTLDGTKITGDLYIDCTGFSSLLLEQTMGSEFESYGDILMNDRAISTRLEYIDKKQEMTSVTNCTALDNGWAWNIPLKSRIGAGYVFSSKFASDEEALAQFKEYLVSNRMDYQGDKDKLVDRLDKCEFKFIDIKHGVHKKAWIKNVLGVGLSYGFIEPLESTGLMLTHENIKKLINVLNQRNRKIVKYDIDAFNFSAYDQISSIKKFIGIHYALSNRDDTPYWKHVTQNITYSMDVYNNLDTRDAFWHTQNIGDVIVNNGQTFIKPQVRQLQGESYILPGHGYNPFSKRVLQKSYYNDWDNYFQFITRLKNQWLEHKQMLYDKVEDMDDLCDFLDKNIY